MSDPISARLARISAKGPRSRTDGDMAFLKWCTSGAGGPPPPEDDGPTFTVLPSSSTPAPTQPKRGAPPTPSAQQLEQTFRTIAAKPAASRSQQENEFLLGIQEMYKQRKGMGVRNNQPPKSQAPFRRNDEPTPPPALVALAQRKAQAKATMEAKQKQRIAAIKQQQLAAKRQQECVTKSDEPDGVRQSPSNFRPLDAPPSKPPRHAIPAHPAASTALTTVPLNSPPTTAALSSSQYSKSSNHHHKPPAVATKKKMVTEEERSHAEKSLQSAMSRRLGDNMMSSLATKDLQGRLIAAIQCGVDPGVISQGKNKD